ncbi:MAG: PDZ domain-containing protein [Pirellulales bacterium]|nr:PDZ domain-containing protein [Pirellulales bacterium]
MKPTAILLSLTLLLSASFAKGAEPVTVQVTIQSVNADARQILVRYETRSGQKTISLDVSRKAEITINGEKATLGLLAGGLKAKVDYHKDLAIVTKIEATGAIKLIDPVIRLSIQVNEFGDVALSACRTNKAAPEDFEGTALDVSAMPGTKAWKGTDGQACLVHAFGDGTEVSNLAWESTNVSIDRGAKSLVLKPRDKTKKALSRLSFFQRVRLPVTIVVDMAQHDSGPLAVKLIDMTGKWGTLYCEINAKESKVGEKLGERFSVKALWVERDAPRKPKITELLNVGSTALDEPSEQKFRLPVPNAKIDQPFGIELAKAFDDRPTAITRIEVRGQLIPMLGIGLKEQENAVFVKQVFPHGLADRAGIKEGDILRKINGQQPRSVAEALDLFGQARFGQEVRILVERAGKTKTLRAGVFD